MDLRFVARLYDILKWLQFNIPLKLEQPVLDTLLSDNLEVEYSSILDLLHMPLDCYLNFVFNLS